MTLSRERIVRQAERYEQVVSDNHYREEQKQLARLPTLFTNQSWEWADLEWIVRWKTSRSIGYFNRNDPDTVDKVLERVVETSSTRRKIRMLIDLSGIRVKMSSAFLLFMDPKEYTVLDWRVANVLTDEGILNQKISDDASIDEYIEYLQACRSTAERFGVSLRQLDRALWVLGEDYK